MVLFGSVEGGVMNINVTAIERNIRLYALPGLLALIGIGTMLLIDPSAASVRPFDQMIAPLKRGVFWVAVMLTVGGIVWSLYRAWLEFRWMQGALLGGCDNCGGPLRHLDGRYGTYSKCLMCGSKRKGWH